MSNLNLPVVTYHPVTDTRGMGKCMLALNPQQRAFVLAYVDTGGQDATKAGRMSGYGGDHPNSVRVAGYRLIHDPRVLEAIREYADTRIRSEALMAMEVMVEIAKDPTHKDRFKAATEIANRSGLMVINKVEHEHIHRPEDDAEKVRRIIALATNLGMDPRKLLGGAGVVVDAEFEVVQPAADDPASEVRESSEGLEDLL